MGTNGCELVENRTMGMIDGWADGRGMRLAHINQERVSERVSQDYFCGACCSFNFVGPKD